jgi:outer membrane protein assembly factor BamD
MLKNLIYILVFATLMGCSEYQKVLKSTDLEYKFQKAVEYYNAKKYDKAYPLFDELLTLYRSTAKAEEVFYYYAFTTYHMGDYILAAYHFKNYTKTFSSTERAPECAFMVGYCYYLESPTYSLDQSYTFKAINELQLFVNTHPGSEKLPRCNELIIELRRKLERKSFERARQYYETTYYQSAVVAFNNTLNDYPDTQYREEIMYLRLKASYELADNSIESKKLQRFIEAKTAYLDFIEQYPESKEAKEAVDMYVKIQEKIVELKNKSIQS